jgi:predicted O-linked N-acetylglucosamine transferase (SPINDLY family)
MRVEHEAWAARHASSAPTARPARRVHSRDRLRIGYVSPRFGDAPLGALLLPVLEAHDRRRFALFAYAAHPAHGETAQRIRASVDTWRELPSLDDDAERVIEADSTACLSCREGPRRGSPPGSTISTRPAWRRSTS